METNTESICQDDEMLAQVRIDAAVDRALAKARQGQLPVQPTPESIRQGEEIMAQARINAALNLSERIQRGEYIRLDQLRITWPVKCTTIDKAVDVGRLFVVIGPSGENYYPAFYGDPSLDRRVLEKVSKALGALPATVKYHFYTAKSSFLDETPLEALRVGRVEQVLAAAAGYVER